MVYEPLLKRLPPDTPMYGIERVEGSIQERAAEYVPKLLEMQGNGPFILAGWSLGGRWPMPRDRPQARRRRRAVRRADRRVRAGEEIPQTKEETRARWDRYARFAERTFNVQIPAIPYEQLEELDDEGQVKFVLDAAAQSGVQIPGGIIEHQRTSVPGQPGHRHREIEPYDGHVTLAADRYHDDAIVFEPYSHPQAGRRLGRVRVRPGGGAHRRAHPGDRRAVHRQGRRA